MGYYKKYKEEYYTVKKRIIKYYEYDKNTMTTMIKILRL